MVRLAGKHFGHPFGRLLLPLAHVHRVNLVLRRNGVDRLDPLQGFQADAGFHIGTVLTTLL